MNCFWEAIVDVDVDMSWLVKVRNYLDNIEMKHAKTKRKKIANLSRDSHLKKLVLEQFDEHLPHFQFRLCFVLHFSMLRI